MAHGFSFLSITLKIMCIHSHFLAYPFWSPFVNRSMEAVTLFSGLDSMNRWVKDYYFIGFGEPAT